MVRPAARYAMDAAQARRAAGIAAAVQVLSEHDDAVTVGAALTILVCLLRRRHPGSVGQQMDVHDDLARLTRESLLHMAREDADG